jgi:hypothetical protein
MAMLVSSAASGIALRSAKNTDHLARRFTSTLRLMKVRCGFGGDADGRVSQSTARTLGDGEFLDHGPQTLGVFSYGPEGKVFARKSDCKPIILKGGSKPTVAKSWSGSVS